MGGAFGHMPHPFDLEKVKSGEDLINQFYLIQRKINQRNIEETFNVKIDGANLSCKLVGSEFALDRGTQKPVDVNGITINRIHERYRPDFSLYGDIQNLLSILNNAYNDILPELSELGMTTDNSKFLNIEFVSSKNVIDYDFSFIAIHGLSQFYEKWKKVKGGKFINTRHGIPNPKSFNKAISTEIDYNQNTMVTLIEKLKVHAQEFGIKVFGPISASKLKESNIEAALETTFHIPTDHNTEFLSSNNGNTLRQWLQSIQQLPAFYSIKEKRYNNFYEKIDGKKINPYHKSTYVDIIENGVPISSIMKHQTIDDVAAGIVILHATRMVGQSILNCLTSEIGPVTTHEGIVIRDNEFSDHAFKITGEYLVKGMFGTIAKDAAVAS